MAWSIPVSDALVGNVPVCSIPILLATLPRDGTSIITGMARGWTTTASPGRAWFSLSAESFARDDEGGGAGHHHPGGAVEAPDRRLAAEEIAGSRGEPREGTVDLIVDAVGAEQTRATACRMVRPGGVIVHIGLLPGSGGVDVRKLTLQEVTFIGSYCYTMVDFSEVVAALASGKLGTMDWIEQRSLRDGAGAFKDIDEGRTAAAKIILRPGA